MAVPAIADDTGSVTGSVTLTSKVNPALVKRTFKRIVIYLEAVGGQAIPVPEAAVIRQKDAKFSPSFLVIAKGQKIKFLNDDDIFHNVFSASKVKKFDLGTYKENQSRTVQYDEVGVVKIHCSIHETMNGTIYVAASPYHATITRGGSFVIKGVLPGRYKVRTWHRRFPEGEVIVDVAAGKATSVAVALGKKKDTTGAQ